MPEAKEQLFSLTKHYEVEYGFFKRRNSNNNQRPAERRERGGYTDRSDYRDRGTHRERADNDRSYDGEESVFSKRVRAGKRRTYFFDVRKTRGNDYFITITESTRRDDGSGYRRHKIFLYKEDFNRFVASLNEVVEHVKSNLLPDFDYEEFDRRQAEWEARQQGQPFDEERLEDFDDLEEDFDEDSDEEETRRTSSAKSKKTPEEQDDLSW